MKFLRNKCDKISSCQGEKKYRTRGEDKRHTLVKHRVVESEVGGSVMDEDGGGRVVYAQKEFDGKKIGWGGCG